MRNAKDYLLQYRRISARVDILRAEIERLRTDAESMAINLDGMPHGTNTNDKTARLAILLADCETALTDELSDLWRVRMDIINTLGKLQDGQHQRLLHARYIEGKTWECIAYTMGITWRHCYRLHGYALAELEKILN